MSSPRLWSRLRKARLVQVLVLYLGASWVVLQIGDTLEDALGLPEWVLPTAFLLLLVGLVVVVATAWIQSHPLVEQRAAADEVPHKWELDASDLGSALRTGKVPHLTWPRALLAGAAAFLLLSTVAATVMLVARDGSVSSPSPAGATALPGLAVMPFAVSGEGSDVWREGMVDLLSTNLDGAAGLRTIDARNVLARWRERFGDDDAEAAQALEAARATGARYAVLGSAVSLGSSVRLTADLYDVQSGERLGETARAQGPRDSLIALLDGFSVAILREALRAEGVTTADTELRSVESMTTASLPALLSFLEGEAHYRRARFREAIDAYETAVAADSTFALPHFRLSHAYGWAQTIHARSTVQAMEMALRNSHSMAPRDAALVRLSYATLRLGLPDSIAPLRSLATRYPDDPEILHEYAEAILHGGTRALLPPESAEPFFARAIELDPSFAPAYIHTIELALRRDDTGEATRLLNAFEGLGEPEREARLRQLLALVGESAPANLTDTVTTDRLKGLLLSSYVMMPERVDLTIRMGRALVERPDAPEDLRVLTRTWLPYHYALAGRPSEARRLMDLLPPEHRFGIGYAASVEGGVGGINTLDADSRAVTPTSDNALLFLAAAWAVEQRNRERLADLTGWIRERERATRTASDSASPRRGLEAEGLEAMIVALDAYARWKAGGNAAAALPAFESARRRISGVVDPHEQINSLVRRWHADALLELGRHAEAIPLYESLIWSNDARMRAAQSYETIGQSERARALWARLLGQWRDAEPDFALLVEAREGLRRTSPDR